MLIALFVLLCRRKPEDAIKWPRHGKSVSGHGLFFEYLDYDNYSALKKAELTPETYFKDRTRNKLFRQCSFENIFRDGLDRTSKSKIVKEKREDAN